MAGQMRYNVRRRRDIDLTENKDHDAWNTLETRATFTFYKARSCSHDLRQHHRFISFASITRTCTFIFFMKEIGLHIDKDSVDYQ